MKIRVFYIYKENYLMKFTKNWTKKDNDKHRQLIKERKSVDEIIEIMGMEKLKYHPNKRYTAKFSTFVLNEIIYSSRITDYDFKIIKSATYPPEKDYEMVFKTKSGQKYVIDLIYMFEMKVGRPYINRDLYNISFTTLEQKEQSAKISNDKEKTKSYEKETNKQESIELMKRLIYILQEIHNYIKKLFPDIVYVIGENK
jgi:hypothetical protein